MPGPYDNLFELVSSLARADAERLLKEGRETVKPTLHINTNCSVCGKPLEVEVDLFRSHSGYITLRVRPCEDCLRRMKEEGYETGYEKGAGS